MTKKQAEKKVRELANNFKLHLIEEALRLYSCGGIDSKFYQNDFVLPKILVTAAIENCKNDFRPLNKDYKEAIDNLTHF